MHDEELEDKERQSFESEQQALKTNPVGQITMVENRRGFKAIWKKIAPDRLIKIEEK